MRRLIHPVRLLSVCAALAAPGCVSVTAPPIPTASGPTTSNDSTATAGSSAAACRVPLDEADLVDEVLQLVNLERTRVSLDPVTLDAELNEVAEDYACEMIDGNFFDHVNPTTGEGPGQRLTEAGYTFFSMGENLAAGQRTAREVVDAWMASPGHRENILTAQWKRVGVAVRVGGRYQTIWVQEFADPLETRRLPLASTTP